VEYSDVEQAILGFVAGACSAAPAVEAFAQASSNARSASSSNSALAASWSVS
jgi:hypothetical protein